MKVYCVHTGAIHSKASNYYRCRFCERGWYGFEPTPLVVIGSTDPYEASPDYGKQAEPKDLSAKVFKQCKYCKDLVEKRKHRLCLFKAYLEAYKKSCGRLVRRLVVFVRVSRPYR
jgi:hypothetical protein